MKMFLLLAVAVFLACGSSLCSAADKPAEKPSPAKKQARPRTTSINGKIKAIDVAARTITVESDKSETSQITITSETRITRDGKPSVFDDLKEGDPVGGRARQMPDGKWEATTVNAGKKAVRIERPNPAENPIR